jgi:hypothetical protein
MLIKLLQKLKQRVIKIKSTRFIKQMIYKLSSLMYHSFRIPKHGTSNTIDNIWLNYFYNVHEFLSQILF